MKPEIETSPGRITFSWSDVNLKIIVRRARMDSHSKVSGELLLEAIEVADGHSAFMDEVRITDFLAERTLTQHVSSFTKKYEGIPWEDVLMAVKYHVLNYVREGAPVEDLDTAAEDVTPPEDLIGPVMPLSQATILFGDRGAGKSQTALVFAMAMQLPWYDNPLGLTTPSQPVKPLWLDYETDSDTLRWILKSLQDGMELGNWPIAYRRCHLPLADDLEAIQAAMGQTGAGALIIDHLGLACGGNLNEDTTAMRFFSALRQLNTTTLLLAHTAKNPLGKKTVFGSGFFEAIARSVWELRKDEDASEDELSICLSNTKMNVGPRQKDIGLRFWYNGTKIKVNRQDPRTVDYFLQRMSITQRILAALKESPRNAAALAEDLEVKRNSIDQALKRLREKSVISNNGNVWGLVYREGNGE